jgi:hypothetical protein
MIERRPILAAVLGVLALTATIHADMMSPSSLHGGYQQSPRACVTTDQQYTNLSSPFGWPGITHPDLPPVKSLPGLKGDVEQARQMQPVQILSDGQTSFSLCLYALVGLGLCKSAPFVKKLSFGCIPEWYHNGGPFQIGHSHAIGPESLCSAPVACFVQPVCAAEDISPEYYKGTIASLLRKSLFTPNLLDPRGPPETA